MAHEAAWRTGRRRGHVRRESRGARSHVAHGTDARSRGAVPPDSPVVEAAEAAVEGAEVELSCAVPRSRPPATLRWYRDRREIHGEGPDGGGTWVGPGHRGEPLRPHRDPMDSHRDAIATRGDPLRCYRDP